MLTFQPTGPFSMLVSKSTGFSLVCLVLGILFVSPGWAGEQGKKQQGKQFASAPIGKEFDAPIQTPDMDGEAIKLYRRKYSQQLNNQKTGLKLLKDTLASGGAVSGTPAEKYLREFLFPSMTQTDPQTVSSLGEKRTEFLKTYLDADVSGPARSQMISITIEETKKILANSRYHPASRLNAVYLLGYLDDRAVNRGGVFPQPSPVALSELVNIFVSNDAKSHPLYLKIAALAGIQRNFEIKKISRQPIDAGARDQVVDKLNEILSQPVDPQNQAVSYWLKRRAMKIGGLYGNAVTMTHVLDTIRSEEISLWMQLDAIDAIANLGILDIDPAKNAAVAKDITRFVVRALENESKRINAAREKLVYDNILFRDIDYFETGTNFEVNSAAATGEGASEGRGGGGGGGKFGGAGAGMGAGMGGPPSGAGGFGGGGLLTVDPREPKVELPNFQMQAIRSRIKALSLKTRDAIGQDNNKGLRQYLTGDAASNADSLVIYLDRLLDESTIGVIDRENRNLTEEDEFPEIPFTQQLIDLCDQYANDIKDTLGEEAPAAAAADASSN